MTMLGAPRAYRLGADGGAPTILAKSPADAVFSKRGASRDQSSPAAFARKLSCSISASAGRLPFKPDVLSPVMLSRSRNPHKRAEAMMQGASESGEPRAVFAAIERAVDRWINSWLPLPLPSTLDDVMLGELDLAITGSLVAAGHIDGE